MLACAETDGALTTLPWTRLLSIFGAMKPHTLMTQAQRARIERGPHPPVPPRLLHLVRCDVLHVDHLGNGLQLEIGREPFIDVSPVSLRQDERQESPTGTVSNLPSEPVSSEPAVVQLEGAQ